MISGERRGNPYNHLRKVGEVLSSHYIANPPSDELLPDVARALAFCSLLPHSMALRKNKQESPLVVASQYSNFLLAEAGRPDSTQRINTLLDIYEDQLRGITSSGKRESRLMVHFTTAWAVLRARAGRTGAVPGDIALGLPLASTVVGHATTLKLADDAVKQSIADICGSKSEKTLPTNPDALQSRLARVRREGQIDSMLSLWSSFVTEYDNPKSTHPLVAPDVRYHSLSKFIHAARLSKGSGQSEVDDRKVAQLDAAARSKVPKPMPLPVLSVLLINPVPPRTLKDNPEVHDAKFFIEETLKVWQRSKDVQKDLETYVTYMSRLAAAHRGRELMLAWDELVSDTTCKEQHQKSTGDPNWPPTKTLNQTLAGLFAIGSVPADFAQALWKASLEPDSPFKADIVTANTALRYAAELPNLAVMNSIISDAQAQGLVADDITYTTLVLGMLRAKRPDLVAATLEIMGKRGIEPSSHMATILIHDLARNGQREGLLDAEEVVRVMRSRGVKLDTSAWTALAAGYFKGQWFQDGLSAVNRLRQSGEDLTTVQYNILLQHSASASLRTERKQNVIHPVIQLFRQMVDRNVVPNTDTYSIVLQQVLQDGGDPAEVKEVLDDMDARNFKTKKGSLTRLIASAQNKLLF